MPDSDELSAHAKTQLGFLEELMRKEEDLDPEFLPYTAMNDDLGVLSIRHPLVYSVIHHPTLNATMNEALRMKKQDLHYALRTRDWEKFVWLHEKPWRIDAFQQICWHLGDSRYWKLLSDIWTNTENLWQNQQLWAECLTAERRYRSHMMDAEERLILRKAYLSEFTVYRGFSRPGMDQGLSWTSNPVVAKFFARRFVAVDESRYVAQGTVKRKNVIAYLDGRSEAEMVILPENVHDIKITELPHD